MTFTTVELNTLECANCHVIFGISTQFEAARRKTHDTFYCPNGHLLSYQSKTEAEKLRDELTRERAQHDQTRARAESNAAWAKREEHRARAHKGIARRLATRVAHGVCPCCRRNFSNVARHMKTKHPAHGKRGAE